MSRSRSWKERSCVYIVTPHVTFIPRSPWSAPETWGWGSIHARNVCLTDARAIVRAFNKESMLRREADVERWDRRWAIAVACVRNKGLDANEDAPERSWAASTVPFTSCKPSRRQRAYTPEEVERLLAACDVARLPIVEGVEPRAWWRGFIEAIRFTGIRPAVLLDLHRDKLPNSADGAILDICGIAGPTLFPWPHSRPELYAQLRRLLRAAQIDAADGFHGLRRAYFAGVKGGAA